MSISKERKQQIEKLVAAAMRMADAMGNQNYLKVLKNIMKSNGIQLSQEELLYAKSVIDMWSNIEDAEVIEPTPTGTGGAAKAADATKVGGTGAGVGVKLEDADEPEDEDTKINWSEMFQFDKNNGTFKFKVPNKKEAAVIGQTVKTVAPILVKAAGALASVAAAGVAKNVVKNHATNYRKEGRKPYPFETALEDSLLDIVSDVFGR